MEFDGLDATEKTGIGAALTALINRRVLAAKIANELRNERPERAELAAPRGRGPSPS